MYKLPKTKMKRIFIICPIRNASSEFIDKVYKYVDSLEKNGHKVYFPHRDTDQNGKGIDICEQNRNGIEKSDEVHIFYDSKSQGVHFDMGMAFMLGKPIKIVENEKYGKGKSYPRMLKEWEDLIELDSRLKKVSDKFYIAARNNIDSVDTKTDKNATQFTYLAVDGTPIEIKDLEDQDIFYDVRIDSLSNKKRIVVTEGKTGACIANLKYTRSKKKIISETTEFLEFVGMTKLQFRKQIRELVNEGFISPRYKLTKK